jgi:hypothetical protein
MADRKMTEEKYRKRPRQDTATKGTLPVTQFLPVGPTYFLPPLNKALIL